MNLNLFSYKRHYSKKKNWHAPPHKLMTFLEGYRLSFYYKEYHENKSI